MGRQVGMHMHILLAAQSATARTPPVGPRSASRSVSAS